MKKKRLSPEPLVSVSVVVPMRNAATTVLACLKSIVLQTYPIREILVVDNLSTDNSRTLVNQFAKQSRIPVRLLRQSVDRGVAASYNRGTKAAKSPFVVFMTSDTSLPTQYELKKLVTPLLVDASVGATYSTSVLPQSIWNTYNFWEKYFAARMVENYSSLMVLKFDCVRKEAFLSVGGFDETHFGGDKSIGGEDADLTNRLNVHWRIVRSDARSHHMHYMAQDYSLSHMMRSKKMYARSSGRILRKLPLKDVKASCIFLIKPFLAVLPIVPGFFLPALAVFGIYAVLYTRKMFTNPITRKDIRIVLVPFLNIFFIYYETFWMLEAFFSYT